jgi:ABC-type nitrate/sulfonate/bicarbonate transport system substrate-binding protein
MEDAPVKANSYGGGMSPALFDSRRQIGLTGLLLILLLPLPCLSQDRIKFPVAAQFKILGFAPLWAASQQGFLAKQGLDVQLILVRGTPLNIQSLAAGSVYVASPTAEAVIGAKDRGLDIVMVGGLTSGLTHAIMGGRKYKTYDDLRGATLGSLGLTSGITFALKRVLQAKGLEYPRDYKLINIGGTPDLLAALSAGRIDAAPLALPFNFVAEEMGFNLIGWYREVLPNYQFASLTVERVWAEKNRSQLVRFMKAVVLSVRWLYGDKEAAIDYLAKEMNLNPGHARRGWEYYTTYRIWHPEANINVEGLKTVLQIYAGQTQAKSAIPDPAQYIDQSYLKEALKELSGK